MCIDVLVLCVFFILFFKQKTAYEMRISDWSSDVCSSDLGDRRRGGRIHHEAVRPGNPRDQAFAGWLCLIPPGELVMAVHNLGDREPGPDAAPIRVAIVDDSTVARAMMGWTLEKAGMDVVATASNGREAISALATANIDVLVLDLEDRKSTRLNSS